MVRLLVILGVITIAGIGIAVETAGWLLTIVTPSLIAILFLIAGVWLKHRLDAIDDLAKIKTGDTVRNKVINVSLLFENRELCMVDNVTFIKCIFKGPCLVAMKGQNGVSRCSYWGSEDYSEHLILSDENRKYNGIGIFIHCNFEFCRFENIAWLLNQKMYDKFLKIPKVRG